MHLLVCVHVCLCVGEGVIFGLCVCVCECIGLCVCYNNYILKNAAHATEKIHEENRPTYVYERE